MMAAVFGIVFYLAAAIFIIPNQGDEKKPKSFFHLRINFLEIPTKYLINFFLLI